MAEVKIIDTQLLHPWMHVWTARQTYMHSQESKLGMQEVTLDGHKPLT